MERILGARLRPRARALGILDPGEARGGCALVIRSSSLACRGFPGACGTMAAGAQHSELAGCGAPWRRWRRPGATCDERPPQRSGIETPPALLGRSPQGRRQPWDEAVDLVVAGDGTHHPPGSRPKTAHSSWTYLSAVRPRGARSPGRALRPSEPSLSCASRGSPIPPRTSASCRPRLGQRPAPSHATTPGPLHRPGHRPPRGTRRQAQGLADIAHSSAARTEGSGFFGNPESQSHPSPGPQTPRSRSPPSPRPPGAGDPLCTGVNGATLQGISRRLRIPWSSASHRDPAFNIPSAAVWLQPFSLNVHTPPRRLRLTLWLQSRLFFLSYLHSGFAI